MLSECIEGDLKAEVGPRGRNPDRMTYHDLDLWHSKSKYVSCSIRKACMQLGGNAYIGKVVLFNPWSSRAFSQGC